VVNRLGGVSDLIRRPTGYATELKNLAAGHHFRVAIQRDAEL